MRGAGIAERSAPIPPKQDRSRQTLDRILQSTEEVLRRRTFDEASLQDIVRGAGLTTGAFYSRFSAKDDLLAYFEEQLRESGRASTVHRITELSGPDGDVRSFMRGMLEDLIDTYTAHRGVLRALLERSRLDETLRDRRVGYVRDTLQAARAAVAAKMGVDERVLGPRFEVGTLFLLGAVREIFLHREFWPEEMTPPKDALLDQLVETFMAHVQDVAP